MKTPDKSVCFHKKVLCAQKIERDGPGTLYRIDEHVACHYSPIYKNSIPYLFLAVQSELFLKLIRMTYRLIESRKVGLL